MTVLGNKPVGNLPGITSLFDMGNNSAEKKDLLSGVGNGSHVDSADGRFDWNHGFHVQQGNLF